MRRCRFILLATLALAGAKPATAPTTLPIDAVATVAQLADRDPTARAAARSTLMSLDPGALPALRNALADVTLTRVESAGLREAVEHVFLTGKHRFAGPAPGFMGFSPGDGLPPTVVSRRLGWDAYRALEDGDAILALRVVGKHALPDAPDAAGPMTPVASLQQLLATLSKTAPGDHIAVRVMRGGQPLDVDVRLAVSPAKLQPGEIDPLIVEADKYWQTQFAPRLRVASPTTRAVQ